MTRSGHAEVARTTAAKVPRIGPWHRGTCTSCRGASPYAVRAVEGVRGLWRFDPALLDDRFEGRTAVLSPLDRLVFDRRRMEDLFADYQLEMYQPAARRQWGYWAMPVLDGDELVGKVDATADLDAAVLMIDAVHEHGEWSTARRGRVHAEVDALAEWLGLEPVRS